MKVIEVGQTKQAHGLKQCFGCDTIVEVGKPDLKQSFGEKLESLLLGWDKYHWECPQCHCSNTISANFRRF